MSIELNDRKSPLVEEMLASGVFIHGSTEHTLALEKRIELLERQYTELCVLFNELVDQLAKT